MGFQFEHTYQMPIDEYATLNRVFARFKKPWREAALFIAGVAALFSKWTFVLGCVLLVVSGLSIFRPSIIRSAGRNLYAQMIDMSGPIKYGVSDKGLSFSGSHLNASCSWNNLVQWRELDGWLILQCAGMPHLFFRTSELEESGVLKPIMLLVRKHGIDYYNPRKRA